MVTVSSAQRCSAALLICPRSSSNRPLQGTGHSGCLSRGHWQQTLVAAEAPSLPMHGTHGLGVYGCLHPATTKSSHGAMSSRVMGQRHLHNPSWESSEGGTAAWESPRHTTPIQALQRQDNSSTGSTGQIIKPKRIILKT